jgi:hypothetical protein
MFEAELERSGKQYKKQIVDELREIIAQIERDLKKAAP